MDKNIPKVVFDKMMSTDYFSQWLGIEGMEHREGYCQIKIEVRKEMLNGFDIVHGGVTFGLADSALAFAANSYNVLSVTLDGFITYPNPGKKGDILIAEAIEKTSNKKTAMYDVTVRNQNGLPIGLYRATVYRTKKNVVE
jgi:acyl-CoA thioesterase